MHPDERVELIPTKARADASGWVPPVGYAQANAWSLANREALESYAADIAREGTAAEQLRRWLEGRPAPDASRSRR